MEPQDATSGENAFFLTQIPITMAARKRAAQAIPKGPTDGVAALSAALAAAGTRPTPSDAQGPKTKYAVAFADKMAEVIANDLKPRLQGIKAAPTRGSVSSTGRKQLDISFSTADLGLALGISLKSVHIRDKGSAKRYTHNMKRNEEELRIEAAGYHKRQPYAVMVGMLFLPFDSCDDAKKQNTSSSFGSFVRKMRPYTGRTGPLDDADRFERLYVALYDHVEFDLRFFDVRAAPPKNARPESGAGALFSSQVGGDPVPQRLLTYPEVLEELYAVYHRRNFVEFKWLGGDDDPVLPTELE